MGARISGVRPYQQASSKGRGLPVKQASECQTTTRISRQAQKVVDTI